jgi:hypothetical protein
MAHNNAEHEDERDDGPQQHLNSPWRKKNGKRDDGPQQHRARAMRGTTAHNNINNSPWKKVG